MPILLFGGNAKDLEAGKGERLYTRTQVAAIVGMSERRVTQAFKDGEITPFEERLFHVPVFPESEVERFRESRLKNF